MEWIPGTGAPATTAPVRTNRNTETALPAVCVTSSPDVPVREEDSSIIPLDREWVQEHVW